jgi:uncharacterized SAM-binding protein YcdF (DUF218 family)
LLPLLVLPLGLVISLQLFAVLLLFRSYKKASALVTLLACLLLWISATPAIANHLTAVLENQVLLHQMNDIPEADCLVLLGGIVASPTPYRLDADFSGTVDRAFKTAELYASGKAKRVIVTAGNQPWLQDQVPESAIIADLLQRLGIPATAIIQDSSSRNTWENAVNSALLIEQSKCASTLLVTSAAHMPRAVAAFARNGVDVFPVSTDVTAVDQLKGIDAWLPQAGALAMTSATMREWLGQVVYRMKDWN